MLTDSLKAEIQSLYRQIQDARDLTPRFGQRQMIAEIANTLGALCGDPEEDEKAGKEVDKQDDKTDTETPICVVEAGTGTGKTLAYLLATLPMARALDLKVVISTATIALQEQVLLKDIPELQRGTDLEFKVALAKGRGRYLCLSKLDMLLRGGDSQQAMMDLYGEEVDDPTSANPELYDSMMEALSAGEWQGDRDEWPTPLSEQDWRPLTVDNAQCSGAKCHHFRRCCFYRARDALVNADCIVTNHDLVLSDLALGGGVILPEPEECIYVFDEAHHLPLKSNAHFSSFTRLKATETWLERCDTMLERLQKDDFISAEERKATTKLSARLKQHLQTGWSLCEQVIAGLESINSYEDRAQHTFALGRVPEALREEAAELANLFTRFTARLDDVGEEIREAMEAGADPARQQLAEQWFPVLGSAVKRAGANLELWAAYAAADPDDRAPVARWLSFASGSEAAVGSDYGLSASPVLAADNLQSHLWQRCAGAVLTSATLSALGRFDMLAMRAGLPQQTRYLRIASPFNFAEAARLVVPRLHCEPGDNEQHTAAMINAIPRVLDKSAAALMLFSSRRQMQDVMEGLPREWQDLVLCQDDYQKAQLIKYHRQRVDREEGSLIFGLASFAEGVDLPGKYCTHVLIARIPFAVPNDPVEMTLAAWVEQQGQNPFMTLTVPDAAFRLLQASGRLLRSESDSGQITLFDERIVSRRYGKQILDSLPPYRREIFTLDLAETV